MWREVKQSLLFTIVTMVLFGGLYHVALWGIGRVAFADQADGSLIHRSDGSVIGSRFIAQPFTRPEYFHPRPSAVDYNAASTGGSNYGPANPVHLAAVQARIDAIVARDGVAPAGIPSEMVTTSGAGWIRTYRRRAPNCRLREWRGVDASTWRACAHSSSLTRKRRRWASSAAHASTCSH